MHGPGDDRTMLALTAYVAGFIALGATALTVVLRGGRLERQAIAIVALAWVASALAPIGDRTGPSWAIAAIDGLLLLYLLYLAAFSRRLWPVAAAGFQLLILATHAAFAVRSELEQWGYFTAYYLWSWGVLAALTVGALTTRRPDRGVRPPHGES